MLEIGDYYVSNCYNWIIKIESKLNHIPFFSVYYIPKQKDMMSVRTQLSERQIKESYRKASNLDRLLYL